MAGFIHDKLDIKVLVLYLLSRAEGPIDFSTLTDLAMCDPGVDYFRFAEAAAELVHSGHAQVDGSLYSITEKGRRNCVDSASSISPVVRRRCDQRLAALNNGLRRQAQVRATVTPKGEGEFLLRLALDDGGGNLLSLQLLAPTQETAEQMAERFRAQPERVYHGVLSVLLNGEEEVPT